MNFEFGFAMFVVWVSCAFVCWWFWIFGLGLWWRLLVHSFGEVVVVVEGCWWVWIFGCG